MENIPAYDLKDEKSTRPGSKRNATNSPKGSAFSPNSNPSKTFRKDEEDYPKSSSPIRSPLSPSKQNANGRRSARESNAWSKPLVINVDKSEGRMRRCLDLSASSGLPDSTSGLNSGAASSASSTSSSPVRSLRKYSTTASPRTALRGSSPSSGSEEPRIMSCGPRRAGSPDSGVHHSPAPSSMSTGNGSDDRTGSRSRNNSGSSSSCLETISTMNESKDWGSLVEDREIVEFELTEHVDRVHEKLVARGETPIPSKEELFSTMETDLDVIARRKKQISYGKNTAAYARYIQAVPKSSRVRRLHPMTPDRYKKLSRRSFDSLIRRWKQEIQAWDTENSGFAGLGETLSSTSNTALRSESGCMSEARSRRETTSQKRPRSADEPAASFSAIHACSIEMEEEGSQDSCASTSAMLEEASLQSPVKRNREARSGWGRGGTGKGSVIDARQLIGGRSTGPVSDLCEDEPESKTEAKLGSDDLRLRLRGRQTEKRN